MVCWEAGGRSLSSPGCHLAWRRRRALLLVVSGVLLQHAQPQGLAVAARTSPCRASRPLQGLLRPRRSRALLLLLHWPSSGADGGNAGVVEHALNDLLIAAAHLVGNTAWQATCTRTGGKAGGGGRQRVVCCCHPHGGLLRAPTKVASLYAQ